MDTKKQHTWLERVEEIVDVLAGSTVGELELSEDGLEITIRRNLGIVASTAPATTTVVQSVPRRAEKQAKKRPEQRGVAVTAPMTGVFYASASPTSPSFVNVGDVISVGQVVALVEAMKVFNEVTSEVAGRVIATVATNGAVVQKGDALLRVEPL